MGRTMLSKLIRGPLKQQRPELFCIHIPKTAGRTFRQALKEHYGADGVLTLDFQYLKKRVDTCRV